MRAPNTCTTRELQAPLPTLPSATTHLLGLLMDEDVDLNQLVEALSPYPPIIARLLMVANSAWSAAQTPVVSIEDAVVRLGLGVTRNIAVTLVLTERFDFRRCADFEPGYYWLTAMLAAGAVDALPLKPTSSEQKSIWKTGALLHNIGLLWFAEHCPQEMTAAIKSHREEERSISEHLRSSTGEDYASIGGNVGEAWGFSSMLTTVLRFQLTPAKAEEHALDAGVIGALGLFASNLISERDDWREDPRIDTYLDQINSKDLELMSSHMAINLKKLQQLKAVLFP